MVLCPALCRTLRVVTSLNDFTSGLPGNGSRPSQNFMSLIKSSFDLRRTIFVFCGVIYFSRFFKIARINLPGAGVVSNSLTVTLIFQKVEGIALFSFLLFWLLIPRASCRREIVPTRSFPPWVFKRIPTVDLLDSGKH